MTKNEFIKQVQEDVESKLTPKQVENACGIVLSLLSYRLTPDEARDAAAQLPAGIKDLWMEDKWIVDLIESTSKDILKYRKREDLFSFVKKELNKEQIPVGAAQITETVFHVLKEEISEGELNDIRSQLPDDIKIIWDIA